MAQDLRTYSPAALPAVDTTDPATMLLLPAWLASQIGAVSDLGAGRTEVDRATGQITRRVATIPRSKMPSGPQRAAIERRITELRRAEEPGPEHDILADIGDLLLEYATARMDDRQVTAKANAYLETLSDLPAWTVREAIIRWRRGPEGVEESALDFAPRPHRLRAMAEHILLVARGQATRLQRILDAEPEEELTEAQRAENQARLAIEARPQQMDETPIPTGHAGDKAAMLRDLQARKARREAQEQAEIHKALENSGEPFVAYPKEGKAA